MINITSRLFKRGHIRLIIEQEEEMEKFQVIQRETILEAHAFNIEKVDLRFPDGRVKTYDLVDHADAVTIIPLTGNNEIIFVKQYRVGATDFLLELPAGVIDPGETPIETAKRELREEVSKDAAQLKDLGGFYMTPGYSNEFLNVFLATDLCHAPLPPDEDEMIEIKSLRIGDVWQMVREGKIRDGKSLAALFLAQHFLENLE